MGWFDPSKDDVWRQLSQEIGAGMMATTEPTEVVYLWFYLKLSKNWSWTN
jgi:hypothetical protein